jgi:hypothetical protein
MCGHCDRPQYVLNNKFISSRGNYFPNVIYILCGTQEVAVAATLHSCVQKVLGSNPCWDTAYLDRGPSSFASVSSGKPRDSISITP